jgi:hypothetical protein
MKDLRKDLLFPSGKLSIKVISHNSSAIVAYKNTVRVKHGQDVKAETKVF